MNKQIEMTNRKRGIVINFPRLTEKQLANMIKDVELTLTVPQLKTLQKHYRKIEKRDPTLDELYFLDEYFGNKNCRHLPVTELTTNSKAIAETYADIMEKRGDLNKEDDAPTVEELADLSANYLNSRGKRDSLDDKKDKRSKLRALAVAGRDAELHLAAIGYDIICKTPTGAVGVKNKKETKAKKLSTGDFLLLITPSEYMTDNDYTTAVKDLILTDDNTSIAKIIPVGENTLVDALSTIPYGVYIDLDSLYEEPSTAELSALCKKINGVIAIVKANDIIDIMQLTSVLKLNTAVLGSLIRKNHISVRYNNYPLVTFHRELLTAIINNTSFSLRHNAKSPAGKLTANFRTCSKEHMISLASAESKIGESDTSPYTTAIYTALTAIAQCVASGAKYTDVTISSYIPQNLSPSDTLSAVLGLYRAEIEICTPKKSAQLGAIGDRIGVSAGAKLTDAPVPAMLCTPGNRVYLLSPRYNAEGLPDFEDMRRMWRYLHTLCREGNISSAFAVGHDGALPALRAVSARCDFIPLPDLDASVFEKTAAGGFIVETPCNIEGIFIGHSAEKCEISQ